MTDRKPSKNKAETISYKNPNAVPFSDAEEAWFWFIAAQEARTDGARFVSGQGICPRPCEPLDILKVLDRLYRTRRLMRDHLMVLRHYGRRRLSPDPYRAKEQRAHHLWREALERIGEVLEGKRIIEPQKQPHENWAQEAMLYENYKLDLNGAAAQR